MNEAATVTLSVRIPNEHFEQLGSLADITERTKSYLAAEAIKLYLETNAWQLAAIQKALDRTNSGNAKYATHEEVKKWALSWGTKQELNRPKCK